MTKPKILTLDIETAPGEGYFWDRFDKYPIPLERVKTPPRVICWSARWLGSKEMMYADEYGKGGPRGMFKAIHDLLSEADAVITYNGDRFDLQRLNGAFVEHRLGPVPPVASIDLIKTTKKLGLVSASLAFIARLLKIGQKVEHAGFPLWVGWNENKKDCRKKMREYNGGDVRLAEGVYRDLRPYITNHPRLYPKGTDKPTCRACGSDHIQSRGNYHARQRSYKRFVCVDCGTWDKVLKNAKS